MPLIRQTLSYSKSEVSEYIHPAKVSLRSNIQFVYATCEFHRAGTRG